MQEIKKIYRSSFTSYMIPFPENMVTSDLYVRNDE